MMKTKAYDFGTLVRFVVLLDDTKTLPDGEPDPEWCATFEWAKKNPDGSDIDLAECKAEAERQAADDPRIVRPQSSPQEIALP